MTLPVEGVEKLDVEKDTGKLTITGKVDPAKLRDKLASKMKKKVDLISPLPKENKSQNDNKNKPDDKKSKQKEVIFSSIFLLSSFVIRFYFE